MGLVMRLRRFCSLGLIFAACGISPAQGEQSSNYRLAANDVLELKVFQEPDLSAEVRLSGDGTGVFPLVGAVPLAGRTISESINLLRSRYMAGYLVNPQISLIVRNYAKRIFTVLGQVQRPGSYEIVGDEAIDILQAVGMAGGYTRIANPGSISIRRRDDGAERVIRLDGRKIVKGGDDSNFVVRPGDVINVGESIF